MNHATTFEYLNQYILQDLASQRQQFVNDLSLLYLTTGRYTVRVRAYGECAPLEVGAEARLRQPGAEAGAVRGPSVAAERGVAGSVSAVLTGSNTARRRRLAVSFLSPIKQLGTGVQQVEEQEGREH